MQAGDQVRLPDGGSGSIIEKAKGGWLVAYAVEAPHPERPDRIIAGIEQETFAASDLELWTEEMEIEHQLEVRRAGVSQFDESERRRLEQVIRDQDFERKLRGRL